MSAKNEYEVFSIDTTYNPPSMKIAEVFSSRAEAEKYVLEAKQSNPTIDYSIREIEAA